MSEQDPILVVDQLVKEYPGKRVLDGVCFSAEPGEILVLMGGSGAGKTTIFNCIIGATPVTSGTITIDGVEIAGLNNDRELDAVRKKFGVAFQNGALFQSMTVGENVALPLRYHTRLDDDTISVLVKMKLEQVGLRDAENLLPSEISGGMQKRAAFARAVALDPRMVFFDEPSAGLDPIVIAMVDELIQDFSRKLGITCVVITHELSSAFRIADRIIMLHEGKIVHEGSRDEVRNSKDPLVHQFIEGRTDGPISKTSGESDYISDIMGS
jgi:phospholipid/cholesterol/gamma-HCH transport system ATP-binding protein